MKEYVHDKFTMLIHFTKQAIIAITSSSYLANINEILIKLGVLKLKDIRNLFISLHIWDQHVYCMYLFVLCMYHHGNCTKIGIMPHIYSEHCVLLWLNIITVHNYQITISFSSSYTSYCLLWLKINLFLFLCFVWSKTFSYTGVLFASIEE